MLQIGTLVKVVDPSQLEDQAPKYEDQVGKIIGHDATDPAVDPLNIVAFLYCEDQYFKDHELAVLAPEDPVAVRYTNFCKLVGHN